MGGEVNIRTSNTFREVQKAYNGGYTTISAQGGARSGKTYNIVIWLIVYCLQHPKTKVTVARATMPSIKKTVFEDFKVILADMGILSDRSLNKTEMIYTLPNGSYFEFISTDSEQKLRGGKRDILFVNEANELRQIEYKQLKMRTTKFAIIDYNPSFSDDHWIVSEVNKDKRTYYFQSTYRDNPFLEQTIIDEIESLREKNPSLWAVYGEGKQAKLEGLVFPDYEVVKAIPEYAKKRWLGMDFGYSADPTAIVEVAVHEGTLYIDEICYRTEMLTRDIIGELKEAYSERRKLKIIAESADPRLTDEIHNAGLNVHPVKKFAGSIEAGINKMMEYKIAITSRSLNAKKELDYYVWDRDKDGKFLNQPIDEYNHIIDATRYVVLSEVLGKNRKKVNLSRLARSIGR